MRKRILKRATILFKMLFTLATISFSGLDVNAKVLETINCVENFAENGTEIGDNLVERPNITKALTVYRTHIQNVGWQDYVIDGEMAGTKGKGLQLEAIQIYFDAILNGNKILENSKDGGIEYRTHIQNIGWQPYVKDGAISGTTGKCLRLEAIQIRLIGNAAQKYDIYYRTHVQDFGWLGWATNDGKSGTTGLSKQMEAIQIRIIPKGEQTPGTLENSYIKK